MDPENAMRQRIVELMAQRGLASANALADNAGVNYNSVNGFLKGNSRSLRPGTLQLVATALHVTTAVLVGDEPMPPIAPPQVTVHLEVEGDCYDVFQALASVERTSVADIIARELLHVAASHRDDLAVRQARTLNAETRSALRQRIEDAAAQWKSTRDASGS